jgi:hypothetical protein
VFVWYGRSVCVVLGEVGFVIGVEIAGLRVMVRAYLVESESRYSGGPLLEFIYEYLVFEIRVFAYQTSTGIIVP